MADVTAALSALSQAIGVELDGRQFYTACAGRTQDESGKKVFQTLVGAEEEHVRILQNEYDRLSAGSSFAGLADARKGTPTGPSLRLFPDGGPKTLQACSTDAEALALAMEFERKGYQMYAAASKAAADPNEKSIFGYLADAEEKHYEYIEKHYKYLDSNGGWAMFDMEHPMFEG
jgi:rubrerythrin